MTLTLTQCTTILDALDFKESKLMDHFEREPRTRSGKPNPLKAALQHDLDAIANAKIAFRRLVCITKKF